MAWTKQDIEMVTTRSARYLQEYIDRADRAKIDEDRERRLAYRECASCYYRHKMMLAGQAFTEFKCAACEKTQSHHNTHTPLLCNACADELKVCVWCGGSRIQP